MTEPALKSEPAMEHKVGSDVPFFVILAIVGGTYVVLLLGLLVADVAYMMLAEETSSHWGPVGPMLAALQKPEIQYSIKLSLISCTVTAILSLWVAVPIGYLLSRYRFPGRNLMDAVLDIPIVLPPLVVGLSLLILFQFWPFNLGSRMVVYQIPAVILAQFMVAAAFAVRTMRHTFDQIDPRHEQVALTLGCSRAQAFGMVVLPEAGQGMLTAATPTCAGSSRTTASSVTRSARTSRSRATWRCVTTRRAAAS
jgi:molybdate transport system permease protein